MQAKTARRLRYMYDSLFFICALLFILVLFAGFSQYVKNDWPQLYASIHQHFLFVYLWPVLLFLLCVIRNFILGGHEPVPEKVVLKEDDNVEIYRHREAFLGGQSVSE